MSALYVALCWHDTYSDHPVEAIVGDYEAVLEAAKQWWTGAAEMVYNEDAEYEPWEGPAEILVEVDYYEVGPGTNTRRVVAGPYDTLILAKVHTPDDGPTIHIMEVTQNLLDGAENA